MILIKTVNEKKITATVQEKNSRYTDLLVTLCWVLEEWEGGRQSHRNYRDTLLSNISMESWILDNERFSTETKPSVYSHLDGLGFNIGPDYKISIFNC